jgi:hypothetical protein
VANQKRSTVWADAAGHTRRTDLYGSASLAGVVAALAALSNAAELAHWEGDLVASVAAPSGGVYASSRDIARLLFTSAAGTVVQIALPAPHAAIFMADGETVDPASIAGLIAAVKATVLTTSGDPLTAYAGGLRGR